MPPEERQSPNYAAYAVIVFIAPMIFVTVVVAANILIGLPTFVLMAVPVVLLIWLAFSGVLINRFAASRTQAPADNRSDPGTDPATGTTPEHQPPIESNRASSQSLAHALLEYTPAILMTIGIPILFVASPLLGLAIFVLIGITGGYYLTAYLRVENEMRRRVAAGKVSAPWWSTFHAPVRRLQNAILAFLGVLILVALLFVPIFGIPLVVGMVIGSLLTGPLVRYRLLDSDSG